MKKTALTLTALVMALAFLFAGCASGEVAATEAPGAAATAGQSAETAASQETEAAAALENPERYGGDLRVCTDLVGTVLDPHFSNALQANYQWMMHVYEPALIISAGGEIYPLTCDYDISDDGLTLKLTVMPDRYFSDGSMVTIEDVVASIERAGANYSPFADAFTSIVTDCVIDGDSVTYTFSEYNANSLFLLAAAKGPVFIMQKSLIDELGDGQITDVAQVIGSGPYTLESYAPDTAIVLKKNESYIPVDNGEATGAAATRYGYMDTISFLVNTDATSRTAGMIAGDYDFGNILADMGNYADQLGLKKVYLKNEWTDVLVFNLNEEYNGDSIVQNKYFRKAVRAALDCEALMLSAMDGDEEGFILDPSPVSPNSPYYNDIFATTEYNVHDQELVDHYLELANYNGETIQWLCAQTARHYLIAVVGVQQLNDAGINCELVLTDAGSHNTDRADPANGHDIGSWEVQKSSTVPTDQSLMVMGTAGGWWRNDEKTRLIELMSSYVAGSDESIAAYREFCGLAVEEVPYISIGQMNTIRYAVPDLELNYTGTSYFFWNSYFSD